MTDYIFSAIGHAIGFRLFSELNPWMDAVFIFHNDSIELVSLADIIARVSLERWHGENEPEPWLDYIRKKLSENGIKRSFYEVYSWVNKEEK